MKIQENNEEFSKWTTCKACRGMGGRYIAAISKKKRKKAEVIFEECSICKGEGKIEDNRTKEEMLDESQNETNLWIDCKDCYAEGFIVDDDGNEFVCQTCEGYGVVKDKRTPEEIEEIKFQEGLLKLYSEEDDDFYGDYKERKRIKDFEDLKASVKNIEGTFSYKTTSISQEIQDLLVSIKWFFITTVILLLVQCGEIKGGVKEIRKDIESLDRSIDIINDRTKILDNKWDDIN